MATTSVGIRELKNNAAQLVRRAARGERIVVTRYGKPRAVLGPIVEPHRRHPCIQAWQRERRAFERLTRMERRRLAGRFVAVHWGRIVDAGADHERLFERVRKRLPGATFFIGRVGTPSPTVDMPGFAVD